MDKQLIFEHWKQTLIINKTDYLTGLHILMEKNKKHYGKNEEQKNKPNRRKRGLRINKKN